MGTVVAKGEATKDAPPYFNGLPRRHRHQSPFAQRHCALSAIP
jgi:hypothetical protein